MTALDQYLSRTPSQMVARDKWDQLSELGELSTRYAPLARVWHAYCAGVMISDGSELYPMSVSGPTSDEAVERYWKALTELPAGSTIVKKAWRSDKVAYTWDATKSHWREVSL